jgi:hypothetical protein
MKWNEEKQAMEKRRTNQLTAPSSQTLRGKPREKKSNSIKRRGAVSVAFDWICSFPAEGWLVGLGLLFFVG